MSRPSDPFLDKPTSVDEFVRCLIWNGWDPFVAFDEGSKRCLNLKPHLIRESVRALRNRSDLSRYTHALSKVVRLSDDDDVLSVAWRANLSELRSLLHTSASGTDRQRAKLLGIARNKEVVGAMRYALRQEREIESREIEPAWIAVLYADGSAASVREANRFSALLKPETRAALLSYHGRAGR
jgi:hypothetical protein